MSYSVMPFLLLTFLNVSYCLGWGQESRFFCYRLLVHLWFLFGCGFLFLKVLRILGCVMFYCGTPLAFQIPNFNLVPDCMHQSMSKLLYCDVIHLYLKKIVHILNSQVHNFIVLCLFVIFIYLYCLFVIFIYFPFWF